MALPVCPSAALPVSAMPPVPLLSVMVAADTEPPVPRLIVPPVPDSRVTDPPVEVTAPDIAISGDDSAGGGVLRAGASGRQDHIARRRHHDTGIDRQRATGFHRQVLSWLDGEVDIRANRQRVQGLQQHIGGGAVDDGVADRIGRSGQTVAGKHGTTVIDEVPFFGAATWLGADDIEECWIKQQCSQGAVWR